MNFVHARYDRKTALRGRNQIAEIEELMNNMTFEMQKKLPKVYSKDLIEVLFRLPYTKRTQFESEGIAS